MFLYNTLVIFCFIHNSLNSSIRYRSSPIPIENISNFVEWMFSVRFYNPIKFSSVPGGVNKDYPISPRLLSTVPRCLKRFKTLYIVDSGYPMLLPVLSKLLCAKQQLHFSQRQLNTFWGDLKCDTNCIESRRPRTSGDLLTSPVSSILSFCIKREITLIK